MHEARFSSSSRAAPSSGLLGQLVQKFEVEAVREQRLRLTLVEQLGLGGRDRRDGREHVASARDRAFHGVLGPHSDLRGHLLGGPVAARASFGGSPVEDSARPSIVACVVNTVAM